MWNNVKVLDSTDRNVKKYVFEASDAVAEAVLYKYPDHQTRTVICCSTQSGCPIGCRFCGAGDNFVRSLTAEEIAGQPNRLLSDTGVDVSKIQSLQIMFMSMGEPMLNLKNLILAMEKLHELYPNAALLISTSGPNVDYETLMAVSARIPKIGLQFSVHESSDKARNNLIPFKNKLSLEQIAATGEAWAFHTGRNPFFNYCCHDGNTSIEDADRLVALFNPSLWNATLSVICERGEHVAAANERQRELAQNFSSLLLERGYSTRVFNPGGQDDIGGGCGQLWFVQDWMKKHPEFARPSIGRHLPVIHAPALK